MKGRSLRFLKAPEILSILLACASLLLSWRLYTAVRDLEVTERQLLELNESFNLLKSVITENMYSGCGGFMYLRGKATGFFHLERLNGVWWLIDPAGYAFLSKGVNHVSFDGDYSPGLGYSPYNRAASRKYGGVNAWAEASVKRLRVFGFNTIGAWSSRETFDKGMPYTIILDIASQAGSEWLSGRVTDYFSELFEKAADEIARRECLPRAGDPYLLGYFTDNELRWGPDWRSPNHLFDDYLSLPPEAPGKQALVKYLEGKYENVSALNEKWNTSFNSFDDILRIYELPSSGPVDSDRMGFLEAVARRYFQVCHDAIRKYDQNHLILGCRFAFRPADEVLRACVGHVDVVSINNYSMEPPVEDLRRVNEITGLPVILTEFSFKAMDSGLPNTRGAGSPLRTQEERADRFESYVRKLISEPYLVGYHWFQYFDQPAEGRFDGENSNFGLVDIKDDPWTVLVERAAAVNLQAEFLHAGHSNKTHVFYVSPGGDDRWSGTLPSPSSTRTDGPFATLRRARDAVRELKTKMGALEGPVIVFLRGGTYFLREPLVLTAEDSGTASCPIVYSAYPGEEPTVSGGISISGWREVELNGRVVWEAEIPEVRERGLLFRELWLNGARLVRARYPNEGYLSLVESPDVNEGTPWNEGQRRFRFHEGDLKAWPGMGTAEAVVMNRWVESRLPVAGVDERSCTITFKKSSVFRLDPGDLYYIENALEFLDSPGEWYLDPSTGLLYYAPKHQESMETSEAIAPLLSQLLRLEGDPNSGLLVRHVVFRGITFAHTEWSLPPELSGFPQAAVGVPASVYCEGVADCVFELCRFVHMGTYALEFSRGCRDNTVTLCEFSDLGAGGIKIGEQTLREREAERTFNNTVLNCHIHDGGLMFHSAVGIWIGQSYNNRVSHNHIHDFYYTGISVGWTWGYGASLAKGNVIEFNHVHNIGVRSDGDGPILSDMGGVYTLGVQPGTVIRFNLFHDIAGLRYGGWGIYLDEGSTDILVENNVVYNTTHGGFHQHYGRENVVRNNIFAFGRDAQIQRSRSESHRSFTFERNIVYWREGELLAGKWDDPNFTLDNNLYWREGGGEIKFAGLSWDEWRNRGLDVHSLIADPLFANPANGDFGLDPESPALSLGFEPIDVAKIMSSLTPP